MAVRPRGAERFFALKRARKRDGQRSLLWLVAASLVAAMQSGGALAQDPSRVVVSRVAPGRAGEVEAERKRLFDRMLADPANLDIAFRYAALSSEAGDVEGAIATLERMLIFAPGLPRLQLELGVLYYRLGAYDTARTYFDGAVSGANVPENVRQRVATYQSAIAKKSAVNGFSGSVTTGLRYQTNANAATENRAIRTTLLADPLLLDEAALGRDDVNGFIAANLRYMRDLAAQGDTFEANLQTYGALYGEQHEINTAFGEVTLGPSFNLERFSIPDTTLSLYGILGGLVLKDDPYLVSGGVGWTLSHQLGLGTRVFLGSEYRREGFKDSDLRPTASDRTGDRWRLFTGVQHQLTQRLFVFAGLNGERRDADRDYLSYYEGGITAGGKLSFASPFASQDLPWVVGLSGGYVGRQYDEPDRLFSLSGEEEDHEAFVEGSLIVPLAEDWSIQTNVGYRNVSSNYDLRDYDNLSTSLGLTWRF